MQKGKLQLAHLLAACLCFVLWTSGSNAQSTASRVDRLRQDLTTGNFQARLGAARALGLLRQESKSAIPELVARLKLVGESPRIKATVAEALGLIGDVSQESREALIEATSSTFTQVREQSARSLGRVVDKSSSEADLSPVITALLARAADRADVKAAAQSSLLAIGKPALPHLVKTISTGEDPGPRRFAAEILSGNADAFGLSLPTAIDLAKRLQKAESDTVILVIRSVLQAAVNCRDHNDYCANQLPELSDLGRDLASSQAMDIKAQGQKLASQARMLQDASIGSTRSWLEKYSRGRDKMVLLGLVLSVGLVLGMFLKVKRHNSQRTADLMGVLREYDSMRQAAEQALDDTRRNNDELRTLNRKLEQTVDSLSLQRANKHQLSVAQALLDRFVKIPKHLSRPHVEIAGALRPSDAISGDFYNWFTREDGSICIYLVDVEGTGINAAIEATHAANILDRTLTKGTVDRPQVLLESADRVMRQELGHASMAITANLIEIYPDTVTCANAGMPPPLLFRYGQAQPIALQAAGVYIGGGYSRFRVEPRFATTSVGEGDLLVLYSDGILEARADSGIFGRDRIESAVMKVRESTPQVIAGAIIEAASKFSTRPIPSDDQTVVVVRFGAPRPPELGGQTIVRLRKDEVDLEFNIINADDAAEQCHGKLRGEITEWLSQVLPNGDDLTGRIWNAVWEALMNSMAYGSYRGDVISLKLRRTKRAVFVEVEQPHEWRDWDQSLGTERRSLLKSPPSPVEHLTDGGYGTAALLMLADSVTGSMQGRMLTLVFNPKVEVG